MTKDDKMTTGLYPEKQPKVLVIGLDGATLDLIGPWAEAGKLPTFARLMESSAWGELSVQLPPCSVPNWPSFATGKNPGKHGVLWWIQQNADANHSPLVNSQSIKSRTVWGISGQRGKRVAVVNVPVTYPPEKVNGVMVTGLLTPPSATDFTYPAELKEELDAQVGGYRITNTVLHAKGREKLYLEDCLDVLDRQLKSCLYLMRSREWDLFIIVFNITDLVVHKFWKDLDPQHPLHRPEDSERCGDAILQAYQAVDIAVDALMKAAGEHTHTMVMSDHGGGGYYEAFFPNNWLIEQGFLHIRRSFASQVRHALFRMGITVNNIYPWANKMLSLFRGHRLRERLRPQGAAGGLLSKFFLSERDIDWRRTKVSAVGDFGQFYINLRGKQPFGIVAAEEYEAVRNELLLKMKDLTIPDTGKPYLKRGYKKEELYHGPELDHLPDIVCEPSDMRYTDTGMGFISNKLFDKIPMISGTHRLKGILFAHGPDTKTGKQPGDANIVDLAPTILYLLGLPVPDDMDGRVLTGVLAEERLHRQPIEGEKVESFTPDTDRLLTEQEEELIKEQLHALGYIA